MSKFEEIANKAKEKASDIADKAKEYDYKEKAKEITDSVKNYDYKNEAENIKKGGIKYFWNKHKRLAIGIVVALILCAIFVPKSSNPSTSNISEESQTQSDVKYKTKLSDEEITNIAIMTFEAAYMSSSSPQFIGSEIIGQDKYGRCAAILEYDLGGIKGRRKFYVFADGLTKDGKVNTNKGIVEESLNNSQLSKSTIEIRKEQFGWNSPR